MVQGLSDPHATTLTSQSLKTHSCQPLSITEISPGDSNPHLELETSFAGEKGGLARIRCLLSPTYPSPQLRHCPSSQTSCTPHMTFSARGNSPQIIFRRRWVNTECSVKAPLISASKVRTMRNPCHLMVFPI